MLKTTNSISLKLLDERSTKIQTATTIQQIHAINLEWGKWVE